MTFFSALFSHTPKPAPVPPAQPLDSLPGVIRAVAPHIDAAAWATALAPVMRSSGIVTPRRIAMFAGQCAVESAGFTVLEENLNYSAGRLCQVWPARFPTLAAATPFAGNPQALACCVYADRMGNGDAASGDGWRFCGRGLIQLTGRSNYEAFAKAVTRPVDDVITWVTTPAGAAASACWFWTARGLNTLSDAWDVEGVTRRINGGTEGLAAREALCDAALAVLR